MIKAPGDQRTNGSEDEVQTDIARKHVLRRKDRARVQCSAHVFSALRARCYQYRKQNILVVRPWR